MKLLLIHRYFWPDAPPYAQMLLKMARRFQQEGHQVTVFSTQPSYHDDVRLGKRPYRETVDEVEVRRVPLFQEAKRQNYPRFLNIDTCVIRTALHVLFHRDELVLFSTMPPVFLGVTVRWALQLTGRAGQYVYHCQDIYPEIALHSGMIQPGRLYNWLRRLDRQTCRRASQVVVLSEDMKQSMVERGVPAGKVAVINNFIWSRIVPEGPPPPMVQKEPGDFAVVFAGNLGRFQSLETVVDAAHALSPFPRIKFWFLGEGLVKSVLMARSGDLLGNTIHFIPYQKPKVAAQIVASADLALVSLTTNIFRYAFPSKAITSLAVGCRLLVMCEQESQLVRDLLTNDLGVWCCPRDSEMLASVILQQMDATRVANSERIRKHAFEQFGEELVLERWIQEVLEPLNRASSLPAG